MDEKPHDMEVRVALLEDFKTRTLEHHRQTMEKLDTVLRLLNEKQCTLHAARMLQLDQDYKELKGKLEGLQIRLAVWTGAIGVVVFIAGKLF